MFFRHGSIWFLSKIQAKSLNQNKNSFWIRYSDTLLPNIKNWSSVSAFNLCHLYQTVQEWLLGMLLSRTKYLRQTLVLCETVHHGKVQIIFFRSFLLVLKKKLFWEYGLALGYNSMKFWDFPNISLFPKILSLKSFGHSWGNSYLLCLLLIITLRFSSEGMKIW